MLEMAVPVWQPALTQQESTQIERVQRCAFYIMLGKNYQSYEEALNILVSRTLEERRIKLCENFAKKSLKHEKFKNWFSHNEQESKINTRNKEKRNEFNPVRTRTERYRKSPLPYLTDILNRIYS